MTPEMGHPHPRLRFDMGAPPPGGDWRGNRGLSIAISDGTILSPYRE